MAGRDYLLEWQRDNNENGRRKRKPVLCSECKSDIPLKDLLAKWQPKSVSRWLWGPKICRKCNEEKKKK